MKGFRSKAALATLASLEVRHLLDCQRGRRVTDPCDDFGHREWMHCHVASVAVFYFGDGVGGRIQSVSKLSSFCNLMQVSK